MKLSAFTPETLKTPYIYQIVSQTPITVFAAPGAMYLSTILVLIVACLAEYTSASTYHEELHLQPLPQSALLATFSFQSNTTVSAFEQQNYNLFPRSLGQILQHTHAKELHLRFSLGRWDAQTWGARPRGGRREGGTGVELWAWVEADTDEEANSRWLALVNALSGLFCASLNFIDSTKTIRPRSTFEFEGTAPLSDNLHLLHGVLPHEVVCTENLTPFLKLLPCKGKAGISSLLDGHKLFDASWQTMAIDVRPICPSDGGECLVDIQQTVDMVLDLDRSMRPSKDPIPRPPPIESIACNTSKPYHSDDTCFPEIQAGERAWSIKEVFGTPFKGACPIGRPESGSTADVHLHVAPDREVRKEPASTNAVVGSTDASVRSYALSVETDLDLHLSAYSTQPSTDLNKPLLHAERTFSGHGQERGGVHTVLTNPSGNAVQIVYLESLPWYLKPYMHTLRAHATGAGADESPIQSTLYRPGIDRQRGAHLELHLTIPAASTVTLTYDFEKAILRYTEYPPDANRGFDVAPAIIRILPSDPAEIKSTYLRTTSLLLPLPTPDFSMPYNVIILTSTVIAMGFGSIFNLIMRRFVAADEVENSGLLVTLKERVQQRTAAIKQRFGGRGKDPGIKDKTATANGEAKKDR